MTAGHFKMGIRVRASIEVFVKMTSMDSSVYVWRDIRANDVSNRLMIASEIIAPLMQLVSTNIFHIGANVMIPGSQEWIAMRISMNAHLQNRFARTALYVLIPSAVFNVFVPQGGLESFVMWMLMSVNMRFVLREGSVGI